MSEKEIKLEWPSHDPHIRKPGEKPYKREVIWKHVFLLIFMHAIAFYGLFEMFKWKNHLHHARVFTLIFLVLSGFGITVGAHRYFSHRSFKANRPLELLIIFLHASVMQFSMIKWVYYHRLHHKYSDTNADHTNASRGFFFAHMGWFMVKKHPDVKKWGAKIDISDVEGDPVLRLLDRHFIPTGILCSFIIPASLCTLLGASVWEATYTQIFRYMVAAHILGLSNSFAHFYGYRPFDRHIRPTDNKFMDILALGEGSHNYHHVFPWDYRSSEVVIMSNLSTSFIEFFAWIGWATDLKTASDELIKKRVNRTGDGTHKYSKILQ